MLGSKRISIRARNVGSSPPQFQKTSLMNPEPHSGTKDASAPGYARNQKPLGKSSRACARTLRSLGEHWQPIGDIAESDRAAVAHFLVSRTLRNVAPNVAPRPW